VFFQFQNGFRPCVEHYKYIEECRNCLSPLARMVRVTLIVSVPWTIFMSSCFTTAGLMLIVA
jgi:hypothetical protein